MKLDFLTMGSNQAEKLKRGGEIRLEAVLWEDFKVTNRPPGIEIGQGNISVTWS